jgi:U4/U6.U5 tri-snRNP-associated protein 3
MDVEAGRSAHDDAAEEGEEMEATNDDDAAMMAMMGMAGFGSTKVRALLILSSWIVGLMLYLQNKQVEGNQEGGVHVKKIRTWRQYMNR